MKKNPRRSILIRDNDGYIIIGPRNRSKKKKSKMPDIDSESLRFKNPIYQKSAKSIYVSFDKCFSEDNINLNQFNVSKSSYNNKADEICRYANTFFKYYDKENEFVTALLVIKYQIDAKKGNYPLKTFQSDILEFLLTDSIIAKIYNMVEDYYKIDLTSDEDNKVDLYALQFTNEHGKAMMALSIAYKLTIPVVCHYYSMKSDKLAEMALIKKQPPLTFKEYLYNIFVSYFPLFERDFDLFSKFTMIVNSHIISTRNSEKIMWSRAKNKKITPTTYIDKLITSIVVDLLPKAIFKKNIVFLIQVVIPKQIKTMLKAKDPIEYCDVSVNVKGDELSGLEKMEANSARASDLDIIISKTNINDGIRKLEKRYNIKVSNEEKKYYKDNLKTFAFSELILQFFAKHFGGISDLRNISKKNYIHLYIIFKKLMSKLGFVYIHQIMTGNVSKNIKKRRVSAKQLKKIENSYKFQKVMEKYSMAMEPENNAIMRTIATLINTPIEYVDYDNNDRLGQIIVADTDVVADEYLRFIKML